MDSWVVILDFRADHWWTVGELSELSSRLPEDFEEMTVSDDVVHVRFTVRSKDPVGALQEAYRLTHDQFNAKPVGFNVQQA